MSHSAMYNHWSILDQSPTILGAFSRGFETLDVQQYGGDVLKAPAHTLILHLWPMLMVHAELNRYEAEFIQLYVAP